MDKQSDTVQHPPELIAELAEKLKPTFDIMQIPLHIEEKQAFLFYLKSVVDADKIQQMIIKPFFEMSSQAHFETYINLLPDKIELPAEDKLLILLTKGSVLIAIKDRFVLLDLKAVNSDTVLETVMESTIHGPQFALSENLEINLNIIRQRYHTPNLSMEIIELNDKSHKSVAILYDETTVKQKVLKTVRDKLEQLDTPLVQSAEDLNLLLTKSKFHLFPSTIITERPDRLIYNLTGGKVIILVDGSPNAIIMPIVFFDLMVSMEDNYHTYWISLFGTLLGYFGLFTCLLLPSVYIAVTSYSPEILRTELALTVTGSRIGVPYPSYIEVLFMLIFMELLTAASIRLPKAVSATATTVGGLILGTAATEAALASNIMIIIVAAVAIATFVIPINELSFAIRVIRLLLIIFTSLFGVAGLILGFLFVIMHLVNLESFGEPYLRFSGMSKVEEKKVSSE